MNLSTMLSDYQGPYYAINETVYVYKDIKKSELLHGKVLKVLNNNITQYIVQYDGNNNAEIDNNTEIVNEEQVIDDNEESRLLFIKNNNKNKKRKRSSDRGEINVNKESKAIAIDLPFKAKPNTKYHFKTLKHLLSSERFGTVPVNIPTHNSITAIPSLFPHIKYCDITGLLCKYTDPKTHLNYRYSSQYRFIRSIPNDIVQQYLAIRRANVEIK